MNRHYADVDVVCCSFVLRHGSSCEVQKLRVIKFSVNFNVELARVFSPPHRYHAALFYSINQFVRSGHAFSDPTSARKNRAKKRLLRKLKRST